MLHCQMLCIIFNSINNERIYRMNIKDLSHVSMLTGKLQKAVLSYESMMGLTDANGGSWNLDSRAFISLGGDHYGNGTMHKLELVIRNHPMLVRECRKLQSEAWGKVVAIRAELRTYGVDLANQGDNK